MTEVEHLKARIRALRAGLEVSERSARTLSRLVGGEHGDVIKCLADDLEELLRDDTYAATLERKVSS